VRGGPVYSLIATVGSTFVAHRAGMNDATSPTTNSTPTTATNTGGSTGRTSNSAMLNKRPSADARSNPTYQTHYQLNKALT